MDKNNGKHMNIETSQERDEYNNGGELMEELHFPLLAWDFIFLRTSPVPLGELGEVCHPDLTTPEKPKDWGVGEGLPEGLGLDVVVVSAEVPTVTVPGIPSAAAAEHEGHAMFLRQAT